MVTLDVDSSDLMSLAQVERLEETPVAQPGDTVAAQQEAMLTGPGVTVESGKEDAEDGSFFKHIWDHYHHISSFGCCWRIVFLYSEEEDGWRCPRR